MPSDRIVINASPLILLCKGDLEVLLPQLFQEIVIPKAVWEEIILGDDIASSKIRSASWLKQVTVEISNDVLIWNLGDGESEVLSLALEDDRYIAAIDDRAARNCARTLAVRTMGTGAILVLAKQKGYLESVERTLSRLREVGLYISDDIVEMLKKQAGE